MTLITFTTSLHIYCFPSPISQWIFLSIQHVNACRKLIVCCLFVALTGWSILIFCDRKKVGNFIAGNDTSQSAQEDQQGSYDAKGKHTQLPADQYLFLGMKYDIHFVTVDVTTFGKSKYKLLLTPSGLLMGLIST